MSFDLERLGRAVAAHGEVVRVLVAHTAGSAPRSAGTSMLVWADGAEGTIGGGALEWQAMAAAREMLAGGPALRRETLALGPALDQCCGGAVRLIWERFVAEALPGALPWARPLGAAGEIPPKVAARASRMRPGAAPVELEGWLIEAAPAEGRALVIWGAGHVGRALAEVVAPLPGFDITLVDISEARLPPALPAGVTARIAEEPAALVPGLPQDGWHLIVTHSHPLDLALCHALLTHGFVQAGLIGSHSKWARFRNRLAALGHSPAEISRIACPIGDPSLGRHPQAIAISVAAALLSGKAAGESAARMGDMTG
ncbi:xanthine dehydrogenase accessory protein XdhC [Pseudoroseicyclus tamaricis]|uniref:Xanthine dehydrogenase accessory protein XdhC n=1 Tax=Pseudoroseicyclus tamaricis TaxID=2705421 RepID=A0A6B2JV08_9RHOB|nr:xanthine dehydrogenase accessory protein XdhC [Pseudoroseicyclus tamaricis]NDV02168.1 xanthine dehydrogenase accessory protein XdhC [Pseudoroseicyclus tamaricis]